MRYNYKYKNMKDTLILEGKTYISARRAAKVMKYAQDYIGQLCRSNKLDCRMVGRSWFVTEESLISHRQGTLDGKDALSKSADKTSNASIQTPSIIQASSVSSIPSPISSSVSPIQNNQENKISLFKYETEKGPSLPEIKKRVPEQFNIKNIFDKTISEYSNKTNNTSSSIKLSSNNSLVRTLPIGTLLILIVTVSIAFSGYIISSSYLLGKNTNSISNNQASVGSIIKNIGGGISYGFNSMIKGISNLFASNDSNIVNTDSINNTNNSINNTNTENTSDDIRGIKTNGIAISPSANSVNIDENTKNRMKNYFSDEVKVNPDKSGTAGVITPVFKKTNGEDFLYVLVPVKEKKQ